MIGLYASPFLMRNSSVRRASVVAAACCELCFNLEIILAYTGLY